MFWILYWQMYCWLAGLAACCFCFLFPFPFSFHLISSHFMPNKVSMPEFEVSKEKKHSQKIGTKKVGPLYSLPPLLLTWGGELTLFTTPLLIASPHDDRIIFLRGVLNLICIVNILQRQRLYTGRRIAHHCFLSWVSNNYGFRMVWIVKQTIFLSCWSQLYV